MSRHVGLMNENNTRLKVSHRRAAVRQRWLACSRRQASGRRSSRAGSWCPSWPSRPSRSGCRTLVEQRAWWGDREGSCWTRRRAAYGASGLKQIHIAIWSVARYCFTDDVVHVTTEMYSTDATDLWIIDQLDRVTLILTSNNLVLVF